MALDLSHQFRLEQQMKLSPRIIQAMEILQLPMMALQERIDAEMESNPVLELLEEGVDEQAPPAEVEQAADRGEREMVVDADGDNSEDFQRLADFEDEFGPEAVRSEAPLRPRAQRPGERDRKMDAMANTPAPSQSLDEYLLEQWAFVEADEDVKEAGRVIITNLDADGYLRVPLADLADGAGESITPASFDDALRVVQTLDPLGVAARDLKECLGIQLAAEAAAGRDVSLETQLVAHFLGDIEMNRLPRIARRTGRTVDQITRAIENLSHLNGRPGLLVGQRQVPGIRPDVVVDVDEDGEVTIAMTDGNSPHLRISRSYRRLARDRKTGKETRDFLRKSIRSAQWLIGAIQQRRQTVFRVVTEVFRVQREFLEAGPEALRPLPMAHVARKVGVHVATISRAVAGKYVQTPRGVFPLRMFFSGGTKTADGRDVAWDAVRVQLKEVIDAEDKSSPLNDDQLAAELSKRGVVIARRTVAKYRKLLDIPPARKRRRY